MGLGQATSGRFCTVRPQFLNSRFLMMRVKVPSDSFTWLRLGLGLGRERLALHAGFPVEVLRVILVRGEDIVQVQHVED